LKPHAGHRQTACIRYISAWPHRSHVTASSHGECAGAITERAGAAGAGFGESGIPAL
jgi:hypothetical protein